MESISLTREATGHQIQWKQLWSLAALYASIIIGWIAYANYQPKLLVQFHFTDFSFALTLAQAIILILTPPIAGKIGDRFRLEKGHRLPIISSGISFAAMVFMAVAFTLFSNPGEVFKWLLPVMIVLWLVSMSIFTSPALSTVELFTPVDKLPVAMAVLTIVANSIYAFEPVIVDIIDYVGAPLTFVAGGVITLLSGYAMQKNSLGLFKNNDGREPEPDVAAKARKSDYGFIFLLGIILGVTTGVMFNFFPQVLTEKVPSIFDEQNGKLGLVVMLLLSAVISWPLSLTVNNNTMKPIFWSSAILVAVCLSGMFMMNAQWVVVVAAVVYTVAFTSLSVSSLPLAIHRAGFYDKVLCVGIFFSGVALPEGVIETLLAI